MTDTTALRELAKAAQEAFERSQLVLVNVRATQAFTAAATPAVVLALCIRAEALEAALRDAIFEADRNICIHENTHRGGAIWTICDDCDAKWADDQGGFKPYVDSPRLASARSVLTTPKD